MRKSQTCCLQEEGTGDEEVLGERKGWELPEGQYGLGC